MLIININIYICCSKKNFHFNLYIKEEEEEESV